MNVRTLTDAIMLATLFVLAALLVHHDRQLQQSRAREQEMFVLANRLDAALIDQQHSTLEWRSGALSCFARIRAANRLFDATINPLTTPEQVSTWRTLDTASPPR